MTDPNVVTSTTRPPNPVIGDRIFETDTGNVLYYYGPVLSWLPQFSGTRLLGYAEGSVSVPVNQDVLTLTIPFAKLRGRQVYWVGSFHMNVTANSTGTVALVDSANTIIDRRDMRGPVFPPNTMQMAPTLAHRESFPVSQAVDVTRKLRTISGTVPAGGTYNLFCIDEGFQSTLPLWGTAIWGTDLWGS